MDRFSTLFLIWERESLVQNIHVKSQDWAREVYLEPEESSLCLMPRVRSGGTLEVGKAGEKLRT